MDELTTDAETGRRKHFWKTALAMWLVVVSAVVIAADFQEIIRYAKWIGWLANRESFTLPTPGKQAGAKPDERQKLLLFGNSKEDSRVSRTEALWRSQPDDPAYFAEYAAAYLSEKKKLPPDFLETARRIDPDNAWFTHLAAASEAKDCVKRKTRKGKRVNGKFVYEEPTPWEVLDQKKLDRAMELLREARQQTECEAYTVEMLRRRQFKLSHETLIDSLESYDSLAAVSSFPALHTRPLSQAIAARTWIWSEANDAGNLKELIKDAEAFLAATSAMESGVLLDDLMIASHATSIAENMAPAAKRLGLHDDAARWGEIADAMNRRKESRRTRPFMRDVWKVSGGLRGRSVAIIANHAESPPLVSDADLKPGRIIDHEILSRIFSYTVWLLLIISLGLVACYQFRVSAELRNASRTETRLLPVDWIWIFCAGVIFPFVYVMTINRLTPLGGRNYGMFGTQMLMPFAHFMGLLVLWLAVPPQLIRWRLSVRTEASQIQMSLLMGWLAVICALAFVPVIGVAALSFASRASGTPWTFWLALALFTNPLIWLIQAALRAAFSRSGRLIDRAVTARTLIPTYALAMLLIISAVPFFKKSEQAWFERETLMKPDPQFPSWSRYEYQVAVQVRKELRELFDMVP